MAEVKVRLREAGIEPDTDAGRRFRAVVNGLRAAAPSSDAARRAEGDAALSLLALAAGGAEAELATYLGPDPSSDAVTWTVVCYEIGDLSPSALRDFGDPCDALATLVRCDDPAHAAAELIACTSSGLRWTAMVRASDRVTFQLPSADTMRSARGEEEAVDARARWDLQLRRWADQTDAASTAPTTTPAIPGLLLAQKSKKEPPVRSGGGAADDERLDAVARTLALLASRVGSLVDRPDTAGDVDRRLSTVAQHLGHLADGLLEQARASGEAVEAQVDRLAGQVEANGHQLHHGLASIEARLPRGVEPRLDLIADRLDEALDRLARLERALPDALESVTGSGSSVDAGWPSHP